MEIRLNKPQSQAHRVLSPGNSICAPWGRGIGKSWFQRFLWYSLVAQHDGKPRAGALRPMQGVRIVHLMPTFKACKDIHKDLALADLEGGGEWSWLGAKIDRTSWHFKFPGGSWIQWFGAREANSARGIRCDVVTVDEADDIDPSVVDSVVKPWFSERWSFRQLFVGGTPRRGRYGLLYREHSAGLEGNRLRTVDAEAVDPEERARVLALQRKFSFHASYRDAPETVDPTYVAEQRAEYETQGKLAIFKREWECDFDSAEGLVYPMFDQEIHVREAPVGTPWSEVLIGADFGYEDPGVFLVIGVLGHGRDALLYVIDEIYQQHQTPSWWRERAREVCRAYPYAKGFCDTARPDMAAEFKTVGARIQPFDKGEIESGVMAVADRLAIRRSGDDMETKHARLYISPRCRNTIGELGKYRRKRDPQNADRFLDDIEDANNHACDALRYSIVGRFGGIERRVIESGPGWGR